MNTLHTLGAGHREIKPTELDVSSLMANVHSVRRSYAGYSGRKAIRSHTTVDPAFYNTERPTRQNILGVTNLFLIEFVVRAMR